MNIKIFGLIFLTLTCTKAFARNEISFIDRCSEQETKVMTPNNLIVRLKLEELDPNEELKVKVTFRPALPAERITKDDTHTWYLAIATSEQVGEIDRIDPNGNLSLNVQLPKQRWLKKVEERLNGVKIWEVEAQWHQESSKKSGSLSTSFYHGKAGENYYQVTTQTQCIWESEATVDSKVFINRNEQNMNVIRDRSIDFSHETSSGITLGYNNIYGNQNPLAQFGNASAFLGWVFKDWQQQASTYRTTSLERTFSLLKNEAGVFVSRMSFNRHKARKFSWDRSAGTCGAYVPVSQGDIDIGIMSEDFVVIPIELAGRERELTEFIKNVRPTYNNCSAYGDVGARYADEIIPAGNKGLLYYYQDDSAL